MAELNHFRTYEIAQDGAGLPLELAREGERVTCLGFDGVRRRFVEIHALGVEDADEAERFLQAAAAVASAPHPAVAAVVDHGSESGVAFYAADLADGEPLPEYAKRVRAVPLEAALAWLQQLADGAAALEVEGLVADVDRARLCLNSVGAGEVKIAGFAPAPAGAALGGRLAALLRALTNYQPDGEEPVYPPEVGALATRLQAARGAGECAEILAAAGAPEVAPGVVETLRPRLLLEREMFPRERPEHALPERYRPVSRAGQSRSYESVVRDSKSGALCRVLVLPPERLVSESQLDIVECEPGSGAVGVVAVWAHDDFRLLAEEAGAGFPLSAWVGARRLRRCGDLVALLDSAAGAIARVGGKLRNLTADDLLIEFDGPEDDRIGELRREVTVGRWPEFEIKVRTHPTMGTFTGAGEGSIPEGAEEVLAAAGRGEPLPAADVFSWYFNLRNRGLHFQAEELVESLRAACAGDVAPEDEEDYDDAFGGEPVISPIAAALAVEEPAAAERDEAFGEANPIAVSALFGGLREDPRDGGGEADGPDDDDGPESQDEDGEDDDEEPLPFSALLEGARDGEGEGGHEVGELLAGESGGRRARGRFASFLLFVFIVATAVGIAALVAHLTGRAFWQQN